MVLIPLAFLATAKPIVYDIYFPTILRGTATVSSSGSVVDLSANPGFAPATSVHLELDGGRPTRAVVTPATGAAMSYAFGTPIAADDKILDKTALYSPSQPGLLPYLLAEYDLKKGGFQNLAATDLAKGAPRDISVEFSKTETRRIGGVSQVMRLWRLRTAPTEALIWTDTSNTPLYWWVPGANYEIVRRGYEAMRPFAKYEHSVSPIRFATKVERNVWVPMRDGIRLQADVYRPDGPGKFPVILQRTCYDRSEFGNSDGEFFAQRGYVYVTQHTRGRGGSEGEFEPEWHEKADGYDSVAWCGTQPWSNGKVGMVGASYNGYCCWMAASAQPKWLKTMISVVPMPGAPDGEPWNRGVSYFSADLYWYGLLRDKAKVQPFTDDQTASINTLPLSKADVVQFGHAIPQYQKRLRANSYDATVQRSSYREDMGKIDMPVLYFDGWLDTVAVGTRLNYMTMVANGRRNQKLIWGPWDHFTNRESSYGQTDFSPNGYVDMRTTTLRWFDRWLKGMPNGIDREPSVSEFVLGENRWYQANSWPPKNMNAQRWYLQNGQAFAPTKPSVGKPSTYTYDPAKFVYSNDGLGNSYFFGGGGDVQVLCRRKDQLVFDSAPLKKAVRLDGPIRGHVFAATDARDTDWAIALMDVHPDGKAIALVAGQVRARYRKSIRHPQLLKPGEVFGYDVDMWETGIRIPAGHRIRVVVTSTLFPDTDRNLNTGEPIADATRMVVAHQKVFHDPKRASYVELPVLRGKGVA